MKNLIMKLKTNCFKRFIFRKRWRTLVIWPISFQNQNMKTLFLKQQKDESKRHILMRYFLSLLWKQPQFKPSPSKDSLKERILQFQSSTLLEGKRPFKKIFKKIFRLLVQRSSTLLNNKLELRRNSLLKTWRQKTLSWSTLSLINTNNSINQALFEITQKINLSILRQITRKREVIWAKFTQKENKLINWVHSG